MLVFVLLYNPGADAEGIYTLKYGDLNIVLMFESGVSANYYSTLLEAHGFPKPTPELIHDKEIKLFCQQSGYDWRLVPADQVAVPPSSHVDSNSWDVTSNLRGTLVKDLSSSRADLETRKYYVKNLKETYSLYMRSLADLKLQRARMGFSVEINRQIEYYTEEIRVIETELQELS
jgi:Protein of unknown function (DUF3110)